MQAKVEAALGPRLLEINAALVGHERLQMRVVAREPWSIENGFLTPTMKIRRHQIETAWAPLVDDWYRMPGPVLWA